MPIGDLKQIHFAGEGTNYADQRYLKNHIINARSNTAARAVPSQDGDTVGVSECAATRARRNIYFVRQ
jgi:hypothetical protein